MSAKNLILTFVASLTLAIGCGGGGPDVETLASTMCTCDEQADGTTWTAEERTACRQVISAYFEKQNDACLDCVDGKVGDGATPAACASVDACTACTDDGD